MSFHALPAYFLRPIARASHFTLQTLVHIPWSIIRGIYNADIVGALEHHYAAFMRAIADKRAPRRASLGAVMDALAWDVDMGGRCWEVI